MNLLYIQDPGHGWLRVPKDKLGGYKPSVYSYHDDEYVYLEEDSDFPGWLDHQQFSAAKLLTLNIIEEHQDPCFIRDLPSVATMRDKPESGKTYRLTSGFGVPSIAGGNTWAESEVVE